MKHFLTIFIFLFPLGVCAQTGKLATKLLPAALKPLPQELSAFAVGNMKITLSSSMLKNHGADLVRTHLDRKLEPAVYRSLAAQNERRMLMSLQRLAENREIFLKNKNKIAASRQVRAVTGEIPYASYLPRNLQTLYIGEWHNIPGVNEEVESLISQLPAIYPGRRIYLATEFLPVANRYNSVAQSFVTKPEQLASQYENKAFRAAFREGIPILPLEDLSALTAVLWNKLEKFPTNDMEYRFAISFEGVHLRNRLWADRLRQLRQMDPEALIVVYSGFGHVAYHADSNLPYLLGGSSFVISFVQPKKLPYDNPFARYFDLPANLLKQFNASSDTKLVESWKTRSYKKILGADLTVILPHR